MKQSDQVWKACSGRYSRDYIEMLMEVLRRSLTLNRLPVGMGIQASGPGLRVT
jgi:hypothetical protein